VSILNRYIAKAIISNTLLVLLVLIGLYTFIDFVAELDDLGKGSYGLTDIFLYILLSMPKRIYELLPIAALLGSVLGLGGLASQSELVVMRASGISVAQISKAVMMVAVGLMIVAVFMGEVLRPPAEQKARVIRTLAQTGMEGTQSDNGFWSRDGLHFNHIDQILPDGELLGISIYEFDPQNRLRIITKAEQAKYEDDSWILTDVLQSTINEQGVRVRTIEHARWKSDLNPKLLNIVVVPPEFLPVWGLLEYIDYLHDNGQAVEQYQMAFWMKIMMPVSSAVMVFLAVPFIFGPLRSTSIGGRILTGALVGIMFHLLNESVQHVGLVFGVLPWLSAALPTVLFALLGVYLMRRVK